MNLFFLTDLEKNMLLGIKSGGTLGWKKHKLESRLLEEISITSDMQMTLPLWQKVKRNMTTQNEAQKLISHSAENISSEIRKKTRYPLSPLLFNTILEAFTMAIRDEKKIKVI